MQANANKIILLVEDEVILAMNEKKQLEKYGYSVKTVYNGESALQLVQKDSQIDLVLMDINLGGGMDGTETAELILKERAMPIVFLSSHTEPEVVEKTENITSYGYVVKNSSITVLDASIKMAFRLFNARQELLEKSKTLHERSQVLENIVDSFPGIIFWKDENLVYQGCSSTFAKSAGFDSKNELLGKTDFDLPWKNMEAGQYREDDIATMNSKQPRLHIIESQHGKNMKVSWFDTSKIPLYGLDGSIKGVLGVAVDISERKTSEEKLQKYQKRLEFLIKLTGLAEWEYTVKTGIIKRSDSWAKMLGYKPEEIDNTLEAGIELQHPDDRKKVAASIKDFNSGQASSFKIDYRMKTKSGAYKWILDCGEVYEYDEEGKPAIMLGTHQDIDKQKKTEEKMLDYQKKLEFAAEISGMGEWSYSIKSGKVNRSERWAKMLDYSKEEVKDDFNYTLELMHPEDYEETRKAFADFTEGKTESYKASFRLKTKGGSYKWIRDIGKVFEYDEHGKPVMIMGAHLDIDELKKTEESLAMTKTLLTSIMESSPDVIIFALDRDYRYLSFNTKHKEVIKQIWGKEIAIGMSMLDVIGEHKDSIKARENFDRALLGDSFVLEEDYGDEGLSRQSWLDYWSPIRDRDGKVIGISCFVLNNSQQKEAESKIRALLAEKDLLLKEIHHRIKNNMNTIRSLLSLQAGMSSKEPVKAALEDAANRVQSMSFLYDELYRSENFRIIAVRDYLSSLGCEIISNFPNSNSIKLETDIQDFVLDARKLQPLGIIVNELLTNAMKYAFKGKAGGRLSLSASKDGEQVKVVVEDDGIGMPEHVSFEDSTGFGLQLVNALAQQLKGDIRIERGNGTRVVLSFLGGHK